MFRRATLEDTEPKKESPSNPDSASAVGERPPSDPRELLLLQERLSKRPLLPRMAARFCRCFSLSFGAYMVTNIIVGSSALGAIRMLEELLVKEWLDPDEWEEWLESGWDKALDFTSFVALTLHVFLVVDGIVLLYGLIRERFTLVKYAALTLLFASLVRIFVAILRLVFSQDIETFMFFFVNGVFYLYGFVILWSYALDEEETQMLNIIEANDLGAILNRYNGQVAKPNAV